MTGPAGPVISASLRVRDPQGAVSSPATAFISAGNTAPQVSISRPFAGNRFRVGQRVYLQASGTDLEDGTLPPSAFTWTVLLHHDHHAHPLLLQTGNDLSFNYPAPEDTLAAVTSSVEVIVEATDSGGLSAFATRYSKPRRISVTLATNPNGRRVRFNGEGPFTGPTTVTGWSGWRVRLNALTPQDGYVWISWSDGGAAIHTVTLPTSNVTYTARYRRA